MKYDLYLVRIPAHQNELLNLLVERKYFMSKAEALRFAINLLLEKYKEEIKEIGKGE